MMNNKYHDINPQSNTLVDKVLCGVAWASWIGALAIGMVLPHERCVISESGRYLARCEINPIQDYLLRDNEGDGSVDAVELRSSLIMRGNGFYSVESIYPGDERFVEALEIYDMHRSSQ